MNDDEDEDEELGNKSEDGSKRGGDEGYDKLMTGFLVGDRKMAKE